MIKYKYSEQPRKGMKNVINIFLVLMTFMFILNGISAVEESYKQGLNTIQLTCTVNNQVPSAGATMNLSFYYPNGSALVNNALATAQGQGSFSYDLTFAELGTYKIKYFCYDGANSFGQEDNLLVTPTGQSFTDAESKINTGAVYFLLALGIIFIAVGFVLMRGSFWAGWTGVFFVCIGFVLLYYDLSLVNYYISATNLGGSTTNNVFLLVARFIKLLPYISWLIVGFAVISIFKLVKKDKNSQDGWDNNKY
jgi:hypothetical protein